jgi:general secretion pathway protein M
VSVPGWWNVRTPREQVLLLVAAALALAVLLGLGLLRPAARLAERAQGDAAAAARQLGEVRQLVAVQSEAAAAPARPLSEPLTVLVARRAGEAGLSLASLEAPDAGRVTLSIPAARPVVLFPWLDGLESRDGLRVETLAVVRNDDASLAVRATLERGGGA